MMEIDKVLGSVKRLHFIGIGGSGIYPLVQIFHQEGYEITGSDNNEGDTVDAERAMGIQVHMGHRPENLGDAQAVIYSAAIKGENPELAAARERGLPTFVRSELLGYVTRRYGCCVCFSGTHGKTTATAMATQILVEAGLDPSAVIGGKLPLINGYGRLGKSDIMTCEADEYSDTFLKLSPDISVILNVDADHLEYFGSLENIIRSFRTFAGNTTKKLLVNGGDLNSLKAVEGLEDKVETFGLDSGCCYYAENFTRSSPTLATFDLMRRGEKLCAIPLRVPGQHNVLNAVAACAAALEAGASPQDLVKGMDSFRGAGRRFEILGERNGVTIADDYAHHPAELTVTLRAAQEMGYRKVWAVFQPFTFSRTALLLEDFAAALPIADHVVLSAIMGGRESNTYGIHTRDLADKIPGSVWFETFGEIADYVLEHARPGDLVLTLGCGDVYKCAKLMLQ